MVAIETRDLRIAHRHAPAVDGLTLAVRPGEHVALFGGTGAGKSTVLGVLAGLLPVDGGSASVLGRAPGAAAGLAYAGHQGDDGSHLSLAASISRSLAALRLPAAQRAARVAEVVELLDLAAYEDRPVRDLSHGARTGVALARALATHPAVLLLDDVLQALQPAVVDRVFRHLSDRRAVDGLAVLHATTSSADAERADRVAVLDAGRCLADAPPADLLARYASDQITVEASDPRAVRRTLRGLFDVEVTVSDRELRFSARDGASVAARLFRHPEGELRAVCVRRGDLWDVLARLRACGG